MSFARLSQRLSVKHICLSDVFHKTANKTMVFTEETTRMAQKQPKAARSSREQPGAATCNKKQLGDGQTQPWAARNSQKQLGAAGNSWEQPRAAQKQPGSSQKRPGAAGSNQGGSQEAARSSWKAAPKAWFSLSFCERRVQDVCVLLKDVVKDVRKTLCFTERC